MFGRISFVILTLVILTVMISAGYQLLRAQTSHNSQKSRKKAVLTASTWSTRQGIFASQLTFETFTSFSEPILPPVPTVKLKCTSPMLRRARLSITEKTASSPMEPYSLKKRSRPITPK